MIILDAVSVALLVCVVVLVLFAIRQLQNLERAVDSLTVEVRGGFAPIADLREAPLRNTLRSGRYQNDA